MFFHVLPSQKLCWIHCVVKPLSFNTLLHKCKRERGRARVGTGRRRLLCMGWWGWAGRWGLLVHGSCNCHSQVEVPGGAVAFIWTFIPEKGTLCASTDAPLIQCLKFHWAVSDESSLMAVTERSIKWQLCYNMSARTWWMVSGTLPFGQLQNLWQLLQNNHSSFYICWCFQGSFNGFCLLSQLRGNSVFVIGTCFQ